MMDRGLLIKRQIYHIAQNRQKSEKAVREVKETRENRILASSLTWARRKIFEGNEDEVGVRKSSRTTT